MNNQKNVRTPQPRSDSGSPAFGVVDIYFVLFRHKWKILGASLAGIIAAVCIFFLRTPLYRSDAKLLIRYVIDTRAAEPVRNDQQIRSPDDRGQSIINSEIELLTSRDLALTVAETTKVLPKSKSETNVFAAVKFIRDHLTVAAPVRSSVITLSFDHPDPQIAQEVLAALVNAYLEKHIEIHKAAGAYEILQRQTDQSRARLVETEKDLNDVKRQAGIVSLEDAKKEQAFLLDSIRKSLLETEQELVTRQAKVAEMGRWMKGATNSEAIISRIPESNSPTNEFLVSIHQRLSELQKRKLELLGQFKVDSQFVQQVEKQIAQLEKSRAEWEGDMPKETSSTNASGPLFSGARYENFMNEKKEVAALEAKFKILNTQLEKVKSSAADLDKVANRIQDLTRQKELEETNYKYFYQGLEQARIDNSIESGKFSNISQIQAPSYGGRDPGPMLKLIAGVVIGGILAGLAWALLVEFFLDLSVRRPVDIESKTRTPVFLTIPRYSFKGNGKTKTLPSAEAKPDESVATANEGTEIAPWEPEHKLRNYHEALRDRLISYFEVRGMNHKPKLVAVTSCSQGAGVTSIAAGLAAALSETGEGNVLLVDLNLGQGAAHPFFKGKPCALPETLESNNREDALVQDHLYWISGAEPSNRLPLVLPKRLMHLVPKLKASDYDYIIFDMPPISQTSVVPRLASMMDVTLFVVESDKTHRDAMERSLRMMSESKANFAMVLNKYTKRIPAALHQEV